MPITIVILTVTVLVVALVLYLVIKSSILRGKRSLGIQKSLGYTTLQIMNQFDLHYTPVVTLGVLTGGLGGFTLGLIRCSRF